MGPAGVSRAQGIERELLFDAVADPFLLVLNDVGLDPGAVVTLDVHSKWPHNHTYMVILTMSQWSLFLSSLQKLSDGSFDEYVITYWRHPVREHLKTELKIRDIGERRFVIGLYNPKIARLEVSTKVGFVNPNGNHLPMQLTDVAPWCYRASAAFFVLPVVTLAWMSVARSCCPALHLLLVLCMFLKSLYCSYTAEYLDSVGSHDVPPPWGLEKMLLVHQLHDMSETLLLLLVSLGWRILRPRLSHAELRFVMLAMVSGGFLSLLQVLNTGGGGPPNADGANVFYMIVKCICYLVVFFASSVNVQLINSYLSDSPVGQSLASLYDKRLLYRRFRDIVTAIVVKPLLLFWFGAWVFRGPVIDTRMEVVFDYGYQWVLYLCLAITLRWGTNRGYREVLEYANRDALPTDDQEAHPASSRPVARAIGPRLTTGGAPPRMSGMSTPVPPSDIVYPPVLDGDYMPLPG